MNESFNLKFQRHLLKNVFRNHTKGFKSVRYRNNIALSKWISQLKETGLISNVIWKIGAKVYSKTRINVVKLYLTEKYFIINLFDNNQLLNKKKNLFNTGRHGNKVLLKSWKRNTDRNYEMN